MKLFNIYKQFERGELSLTQAAEQLGLTERDMRFKLTKYGRRLPTVLKTLDRIAADRLSRGQAAEILGVSERRVNALMEIFGVQRPIKSYLVNRGVSAVKWEIRKKFAIEYIADTCTIEEAAERAGVSDRQMRRWVSELLDKHYGMVFKDLRELSNLKRKRLADEIETAEGLEISKQNVLKEVVDGEIAIEAVALSRLMAKHSRSRSSNVRRE